MRQISSQNQGGLAKCSNQPLAAQSFDEHDGEAISEESESAKIPRFTTHASEQLEKGYPVPNHAKSRHDTRKLSKLEEWEAVNGGVRFFSELQTSDKHRKDDVSEARLMEIRGNFVKMRSQLKQTMQACEDNGKPDKEQFYRKVQLWVLDGFLDHNLSLQRLQRVANVYKRIHVVPNGYNQADLWWQQDVEP